MKLEAMIVRLERAAIRSLPSGMVLLANAQLHRWKGEPELRELSRLVTSGSIAVDVGAHFGTYSYPLARLVGKRGRVVCVEPIDEDARFLRAAARQLRLPMEVHHCALSSSTGFMNLRVPELHGKQKTALSSLEATAHGGTTREVVVKRLDDMLEGDDRSVSFIKIDVEGHEIEVLSGAAATIARHKPNMLVECDRALRDGAPMDVFDLMLDHGYRGEFINATGLRRPIADFDPEEHQNARHNVLSPEYIANFMFTPA
ncbi:MAG: FkbM family methyltransferase [Thermomicrobiales bacterium]